MYQGKEEKIIKSEEGITLIALIITIVVLLILAGVSISLVVGENGVINKATSASEKTKVASEKEAIELAMSDIKTGLILKEEIPDEKYLGEKLSGVSAVSGTWKTVTVGEEVYDGDGWYLVEKEEEIPSYGKAKMNWLVNYNTGKVVELEEGKYIIKSADGSGAITDESLSLNINPSNLQHPEEWGDSVQFCGGTESDDSGIKATEIKFDGVDDYLRINNVNVSKSGGVTFEFYGKDYGNIIYLLNRTFFDGKSFDLNARLSAFRTDMNEAALSVTLGLSEAQSEHQGTLDNNKHWVIFHSCGLSGEDYISFTLNLDEKNENYGEILVYQNGLLVDSTKCASSYLESGDVFNNDMPFTVGCKVSVTNLIGRVDFSQFDLYACRLYNRILTDEEIKYNYDETTEYHNKLVN